MKTLLRVLFGLLPLVNFAAGPTPVPRSTPAELTREGELTLSPAPVPRSTTTSGLPRDGEFAFSLLPKSFQKNPTFEMTVNTEFTDYGRLLRAATPDQPIYYATLPAGYKQLGGPMGGEHPPVQADVERAMAKALAVNGYLPFEKENLAQRASLVVIYYWGSHNTLDPETRRSFPELAAKNKLERAILVGGKKYASEEGRVMEFGESMFDHDQKQEFLRDQISHDVYYVVASAYDYASLAKGIKKLAWRTTMTVNTTGVSMKETLVPLIATAGPFFGHETPEPQIEVRRTSRKAQVEVGTPTVVSDKPGKK